VCLSRSSLRHNLVRIYQPQVRVWEANLWREVSMLEGHDDVVWVCAWSPDGTRLASASSDKTVRPDR